MSPYKLSKTLCGHESDVRCVITPTDDLLISGSRDSTVRVWRKDTSNKFASTINFKSAKFVNCLAYYNDGDEQLIVSAGNDGLINLTSIDATLDVGDPQYVLVGHEKNVCRLESQGNRILSGSWDGTAKVWNKHGEILYNLKGHKGPVWGVSFIPGTKDGFVTCGADKTIKIWRGSKAVHSFVADDDVLRDVTVLPNGDILSCANDGIIKQWDGQTYQLKMELKGHSSVVYSLALFGNGTIVSSSEDRSVRVWQNGKCIQAITIPCVSAWEVSSFPNGDIAVACSDGKIRIYSKDSSRWASSAEIASYNKEVSAFPVSEGIYGNLNKTDVPSKDILQTPGSAEGETRMVKGDGEASPIEIYQWSVGEWQKVGEIVSSAASDKKAFYNGSFYDYVFDVDVEDGKPPLKLPFNVSDNVYEVAANFLAKNNMPASYLDQVVRFIMTNAQGATLQQEGNKSAEPGNSSIFPQREYLVFDKFNAAKIVGAFTKLNSKQSSDSRISPSRLETLIDCEDWEGLCKISSHVIRSWIPGTRVIGFDILRWIIPKIKPFESLFGIVKIGLTSNDSKEAMMAIRVLCNIFSAGSWGEQTLMDPGVFDVVLNSNLKQLLQKEATQPQKKQLLSISCSTFLTNYSVLVNKFKVETLYSKSIEELEEIVPLILSNEEASYRSLIAIGTLSIYKKNEGLKELAQSIAQVYSEKRFKDAAEEIE